LIQEAQYDYEDEDGEENIDDADKEEICLQNFYTDLEKQPLMTKYTIDPDDDEEDYLGDIGEHHRTAAPTTGHNAMIVLHN
jgi:patatin-like phospholipase/acyl hydrolase